jgi:hypothetical protein
MSTPHATIGEPRTDDPAVRGCDTSYFGEYFQGNSIRNGRAQDVIIKHPCGLKSLVLGTRMFDSRSNTQTKVRGRRVYIVRMEIKEKILSERGPDWLVHYGRNSASPTAEVISMLI